MSVDRATLARAWLDARWTQTALGSRADLERRQARLWRRMSSTIRRTPALAHLAGRPLAKFPLVTPQAIRADFARWNTLGLTLAEAEAGAEANERGAAGEVRPGVAVGYSTGSTGRRGLFVSTSQERGAYLGHALARLLPTRMLLGPLRIALCLRADNRLYSDVEQAGRVRFRFFGLEPDRAALEAFDPHVLIGASHVLADLARAGSAVRPERLFYGAEAMGERERVWIAAKLGSRPDPIYQATEGFLGCACRRGTLHLNEDVLAVELASTPAPGCFQPIVTDLRRTSQPMVRVLLDDLVEPLEAPCPCGSPRRAVRPLAGRVQDLWRWDATVITPREVTEAVEAAVPHGAHWLAKASLGGVRLEADAENAEAAGGALKGLLRARGVDVPVTTEPLTTPDWPKRRRVRWRDG